MGNSQTMCCDTPNTNDQDKIIIDVNKQDLTKPESYNHNQILDTKEPIQIIKLPQISENIRTNLEKYNPFSDKLNNYGTIKKFGNQIYQGQLDENGRPNGFGKMYYSNGSLYIGQFKQGYANGQAHYVWSDGSFYRGHMKNNKADDVKGHYECGNFIYDGQIKDNQIHGKGIQTGEHHSFNGVYEKGKRKSGNLEWEQNQKKKLPMSDQEIDFKAKYAYQGDFDEKQQFTGKGILITPKGTYKGQFKNGKKNGFGIFQYQNKLRYEGEYVDDVKNGKGTIYTKQNSVAYSGQIRNGLPHGKGQVPGPDGSKNQLSWNEGISSQIIVNNDIKKTFDKMTA